MVQEYDYIRIVERTHNLDLKKLNLTQGLEWYVILVQLSNFSEPQFLHP